MKYGVGHDWLHLSNITGSYSDKTSYDTYLNLPIETDNSSNNLTHNSSTVENLNSKVAL